MTIAELIRLIWPVGVALFLYGIRVEVGQNLSRQRLKSIEEALARERQDRKETVASVHARLSRQETELGKAISEIRNDIKTLLSRQ
jgi:hypothetical protein